jgi:hypothetical protein
VQVVHGPMLRAAVETCPLTRYRHCLIGHSVVSDGSLKVNRSANG